MIDAMTSRSSLSPRDRSLAAIEVRWRELIPRFRIWLQNTPGFLSNADNVDRLSYWESKHRAFCLRSLDLGLQMRTLRRLSMDDLREGIGVCEERRTEYLSKMKRRKPECQPRVNSSRTARS